jgi:hypothetical protein
MLVVLIVPSSELVMHRDESKSGRAGALLDVHQEAPFDAS